MSDTGFRWNPALGSREVLDFIAENKDADLRQLAFRPSPFVEIDRTELMQQWEGRQRIRKKLPTWYVQADILYPAKLNLEQCSSERTAEYKASLCRRHFENKDTVIADLTGGFGVDSFALASEAQTLHYCEQNADLAALVQHNAEVMGLTNIRIYPQEARTFFLQSKLTFDLVYADPARRGEQSERVFALADTQPNIKELLELLPHRTHYLLLKTSPFLDIHQGLEALPQTEEIHIVAVGKEVKELLWWIPFNGKKKEVQLICSHWNKEQWNQLSIDLKVLKQCKAHFGPIEDYVYLPNPALMKSGAFDWISQQLQFTKLNPQSHLYTSAQTEAFPGKRFKVQRLVQPSSKNLKPYRKKAWEVICRNYPDTVESLRKKHQLIAGGKTQYLLFTRDIENKPILIEAELETV